MNKQAEYCELTNMVMIQDEKGNVLVQNSKNPNGYTLPTGHIELGESFVQSAMRDVKEKTGLNVEQLCLCGTKQFISSDNCRHIVFYIKQMCLMESKMKNQSGFHCQIFMIIS